MTIMTTDMTEAAGALVLEYGSPLGQLRRVAAAAGIDVKEDVDFAGPRKLAAVVACGQNIGLSRTLKGDNLRAEVLAMAIAAAAFMTPAVPGDGGYAITAPKGFIAIYRARQHGQPDFLGRAAAKIARRCGLDSGAALKWSVLEF